MLINRGRMWIATVVLSVEKVNTATLLLVIASILVVIQSNVALLHTDFDGSRSYGLIAENFARRGLYSLDGVGLTANRAPVYPLYLALLVSLFGHNYELAAIASQALVGVACGVLTFLVSYRVFKNKLGSLLCSLLFALHYRFHVESISQRETVLFSFLLLLFFYLLTLKKSLLTYIGLAVVAAVAHLTRPTGILLLPLVFVVLLFNSRDARWFIKSSLFVSVFMLASVVPWYLYIHSNFHTFSFLPSSTAGINLYHGNNPDFHKVYPYLDVDRLTPVIQELKHERGIEEGDELLADQFFKRESYAFIAQNPLRFLGNGVIKVVALYSPVPTPLGSGSLAGRTGNVKFESYRFQSIGLTLVTHFVVVVAMLLGTLLFLRQISSYSREQQSVAGLIIGLMVLMTVVYTVTVGETRYRLPFDPLLLVLSGEAYGSLAKRFSHFLPFLNVRPGATGKH